MRKEFLKELTEATAEEPTAPQADPSVQQDPPANQPEIVVPKNPEQQKRAVQTFLYFINNIRIKMNTFTKTLDKLNNAVAKDNDFGTSSPQQESVERTEAVDTEPAAKEDTNTPPTAEPKAEPEKRPGLADAKKKWEAYKTEATDVATKLKRLKEVFAGIAQELNSFYGTIKEAPQIDIATIIAFLQTYQNQSEFANVSTKEIYAGGPTLQEIMNVYKFLNQEMKKQKEIIKILTPFVGEEDQIQSPDISQTDTTQTNNGGDVETAEAGDKYKPIDGFIASIRKNPNYNNELAKLTDDTQLKELILFIRSIRKDKVSESINEGLFSDLIDGFFGSTNYEESYDKGEAPIIKTAKDLKNYTKFIKQKSTTAFQDVPPADRAAAEEVRQEKEKLFDFIETTDVEITDKLYSKDFIGSFTTINKFMNENKINNDKLAILSRIYGVVAFIIRIEMDDKLDVKKVFNNSDKIKDWMISGSALNNSIINQLLDRDEPKISESLIKKLIRQEVKQHMKVRIKESLRLQKGPLSQGLVRKLSSLDEEFEDYYNRFLTIYNKMREIPADARTDSNTDQLAIDFVTNLFADLNRPLNEEDMPIPKWKDIDDRYKMLYSEFENLIDLEDNFDEAKAKENINFFKREYQKFLTMLSSIAQSGKIGDQTLKINEVKRLIKQELKVLNGKKMVRN